MQTFTQRIVDQMLTRAEVAAMKEPDQLTDGERVALAMAAGCEVAPRPAPLDPSKITFYTVNPVGFARLRPGEPLRVFERKNPPVHFSEED